MNRLRAVLLHLLNLAARRKNDRIEASYAGGSDEQHATRLGVWYLRGSDE